MQQPIEQPAKRSATQRLEDTENALMSLYQVVDNIARDILTLKEAIKLLGNKVDSIVKVSLRGETMTDDNIAKIMVENNVEELKNKVQNFINSGVLTAAETSDLDSFIVGRELGPDNSVQNPRLQFTVRSLQEDVRNKMIGTKVGQVLEFEGSTLKFEVQEIYSTNLAAPLSQVADEQAAAATTETTTDTPS